MPGRVVYVGKVSDRTRERDLDDLFSEYGKVLSVSLKVGYAFIEFDDPRDAEDAVSALDGHELHGERLIVEFSKGGGRSDRSRRRGPPVHTDYRVTVDGLSSSCNWRDLKDLMRSVGAIPTFADVYRDGVGVVEFETAEDMRRAIRELDDTRFQGHRIYLKEQYRGDRYEPYKRSRRSRSRSRSPSPRRSRSRSPRRSRSRSPRRSRSRSPRRSRSRTPRSRSRSPRRSRSRTPRSRSPSPSKSNGDKDNKD